MRVVERHRFGEVEAYELGYSPVGRPFMTVHFYRHGDLLIDSGQSRMQPEALALATERPFSRLLLTHHHEDHSGNAAAIAKRTGAPVLGHPLCAEKMRAGFRILPYQHLVWGAARALEVLPLPEVVEGEGVALWPVHTPGHSKDLTVFHDRERGLLFSGDLYLADRIKYFRADEKVGQQIQSLRRALELDFDTLLCAHRPVTAGGKARLAAKLAFLEDFVGAVGRLRAEGCSVAAIRRALPQKELWGTFAFTLGNVGFGHMVRSAVDAFDAGELDP